MRHKHADLIHAWAEGAKIQHRASGDPSGEWVDCNSAILWWDGNEYRVKPTARVINYRNYVTPRGDIGVVKEGEPPPVNFGKWIGGWLEHTVEV